MREPSDNIYASFKLFMEASQRQRIQVFHPHVVDNRCFIIDSPSKSNSLGGIRQGLILMGEVHIEGLEKEIRCRSLNPAVFGSTTFALCRLGNLCFYHGPEPARRIARFVRRYLHTFYRQYPSDFVPPVVDCVALIQTFVADYCKKIAILRERITANQASIVDVLGEILDRSIILDGGFNVLVSSDKMKAANEVSDQQELVCHYGVCVLTQRCFQLDAQDSDTYFLRLSLSVPEDDFRKALEVMRDYFDAA